MMSADDVAGLSPQQIQDRFDFPNTPNHITDVTPPAGTPIRRGTVNERKYNNTKALGKCRVFPCGWS